MRNVNFSLLSFLKANFNILKLLLKPLMDRISKLCNTSKFVYIHNIEWSVTYFKYYLEQQEGIIANICLHLCILLFKLLFVIFALYSNVARTHFSIIVSDLSFFFFSVAYWIVLSVTLWWISSFIDYLIRWHNILERICIR